MSLRVWLPLTKDLRNQGLDDVTVTNSGATFDTNGKLGGCYSFDGNHYFQSNKQIGEGWKEITFACWVYLNEIVLTSGSWYRILGIGAHTRAHLDIASNNTLRLFVSQTGTTSGLGVYSTTIGQAGKWYHLCGVLGNNYMSIYINGLKESEKTIDSSSITYTNADYFRIGSITSGNAFNGKISDVRVYDHALSPLEVKEISKGLILHYPLNRNGFGVDNILVNTHFDSHYTQSTGWDTTKNGTQLASSWGGYNGGVSNSSTVYHAHLKEFNGEWVYEYIKTANENWLGISQSGLQSKLTAGKTYTFSWEEYHVNGTNRVGTGLYYYKTGATSANFHLGIRESAKVIREIGRWQKYTYTFTAPSDADWSKNMIWYIYGHYNGNGTFYVRHIKLEEGSVATPWCPNSADALATIMGLNDNIEYDTSGYGNNGTRTGTFSWTSNTPKYLVSMIFLSGSNYIDCGASQLILPKDNITVSLWVNYSTWGNPISCTEGGGWNFENSSSGIQFPLYISGVGYKVANSGVSISTLQNEWHMLTGTFDKINVKIYIDGQLKATTPTGSTNEIGYANNHCYIGAEASGGTSIASASFIGKISDVRVYATALSADDVKSLYSNSAYIDNQGNVYGALYEEV